MIPHVYSFIYLIFLTIQPPYRCKLNKDMTHRTCLIATVTDIKISKLLQELKHSQTINTHHIWVRMKFRCLPWFDESFSVVPGIANCTCLPDSDLPLRWGCAPKNSPPVCGNSNTSLQLDAVSESLLGTWKSPRRGFGLTVGKKFLRGTSLGGRWLGRSYKCPPTISNCVVEAGCCSSGLFGEGLLLVASSYAGSSDDEVDSIGFLRGLGTGLDLFWVWGDAGCCCGLRGTYRTIMRKEISGPNKYWHWYVYSEDMHRNRCN